MPQKPQMSIFFGYSKFAYNDFLGKTSFSYIVHYNIPNVFAYSELLSVK